MGADGAVSYCCSLTLHGMLRLPGGRYRIAVESQTGAERNEASGGKVRCCAALCPCRYDEERGARLKAVEIIVEKKPWSPSAPTFMRKRW